MSKASEVIKELQEKSSYMGDGNKFNPYRDTFGEMSSREDAVLKIVKAGMAVKMKNGEEVGKPFSLKGCGRAARFKRPFVDKQCSTGDTVRKGKKKDMRKDKMKEWEYE